MDNSTGTSLEDEENSTSVTVDELLSSVLQTKSLLRDRIRYTLPVRRSRYEENESTPFNRKATGNLSDPSSRIQQIPKYTPKDARKMASLQSGTILTDKRRNLAQSHQLHRLPQSTSKISRSVSTPEINFKFTDPPTTKKSEKVHRKVDFSDLVSGEKETFEDNKEKISTAEENIFLKESVFGAQRTQSSRRETAENNFNLLLTDATDSEITKSSSLSNIYMPKIQANYRKRYVTPLSERLKPVDNEKQNILTGQRHPSEHNPPKILTKHLGSSKTPTTNTSNKENLNCVKSSVFSQSQPLKEKVFLEPADNASLFKTPKSRVPLPHPAPSPALSLGTSDIIVVNGLNYFKQKEFGKGGSSVVYEVWDLQIRERRAIKIVNLEHEEEATRNSYKNEIEILKRLQYSNRVIKLFDHEETANNLKIVMEAGDIDLAKILSEARRNKTTPISAFSVKHYWQGMLLAVQVIHDEGIIHSDLKPANFLLVNGTLKLIDFGIASSVQQDMTSVFKDSQSGTYNYMSPESLNDIYSGPIINGKVQDKATIKISVKSDVWSLGCILYNLVYGKTPFQHIMNPLQKLAAISNVRTTISFPPVTDKQLLDVMQNCLQFDPKMRPSIQSLLRHPYLDGGLTLTSENSSKVQSPAVVQEFIKR